MSECYDREGQPISHDQWGRLRQDDPEYFRVAVSDVAPPSVHVSTVWLGLNHQYGAGPPLIFETMIFGGQHDQWCMRYSTEAEAKEGHARVVAAIEKGTDPDEALA